MRKLLAFLVAALFVANVFGQSEPKNYAAAITKFTFNYNNNKPDSIYKVFGPEMRSALTPEQFKTTTGQLKAQLGSLNKTTFKSINQGVADYNAEFQNGELVLRLSLNATNQIVGLLLQPAAVKTDAAPVADDASLTETPIVQKIFSGNISGTLTMPKNASGKIPVVLIIAGSGPTDRDGNNPLGVSAYTYKLLSIALGKNGIASVRYDKRMIGKSVSTTKEKDLRFDDYTDDAVSLIGTLHDDPRFSKIIVLGHSEGSLVGMLASVDQPVSAFISVAGAADRADKLVTEQLKSKPQFIQDQFKAILDSMRKGKTTDMVDPALYSLARPSIQKYLMSWFYHEPIRDIKKLKIPILILQGTTDLQITVADAEKLKKAKSDAQLVIIPDMNHVLKEAPADKEKNMATYQNASLPLKPELVTSIVGFIGKLK
jgi:pimeloyl-ACP methyl ester carboxylesterase